jgi:hypothetical protein
MINFDQLLLNLDGTVVKEGDRDITLKLLSVGALSTSFQDEQNLSATDKFKRGALAMQIYNATEPFTLKSEDITMLKGVIGKAYSPLIVYKAYQLLDEGEK